MSCEFTRVMWHPGMGVEGRTLGNLISRALFIFDFPPPQTGSKKFNRAKLLNVGYLEALKEEKWDCFVFHDVDLVPENDFNLYTCGDQPKHLVVGRNSTGYR